MKPSTENYLCFPLLGKYGRLGNQLFQYASLVGISAKCGHAPLIPSLSHSLSCFKLPFSKIESDSIHECFEYLYAEPENDLRFNEELFKLPARTALTGYFQNTKYFSHVEEQLRKELTFKDEIFLEANKQLRLLCKNGETPVSVHVRRTDYLKFSDIFEIPTFQYYASAIELMKKRVENPIFIFFTDDKIWVKQNYSEFAISENEIATIDLCMMSLCKHHIICNSSFSWWGAWLAENQSQIVIRPNKWFTSKGPAIDEGMFRNTWEILDAS